MITATFISALYFLDHAPDALLYLIGENAIEEELRRDSLKITKNPLEATHVLVGLDRFFTYEKLHSAMTAVRNGAKLILTNPDPICPAPRRVYSRYASDW